MRTLIILFAVSVNTPALIAQWVQGGMYSTFDSQLACHFIAADTGCDTRGQGGFIRTVNGDTGGGFTTITADNIALVDIHGVNANGMHHVWVVGWTTLQPLQGAVYYHIPDQDVGSFDYWQAIPNRVFRSVRVLTPTKVLFGGRDLQGNGTIEMTTNPDLGPSSLTNVGLFPGQQISNLFFLDTLTGFAISNGTDPTTFNAPPDSGAVYRTTDGGYNWEPIHHDTTSGFNGVRFRDPLHGCIARNDGVILRTEDGGENWTIPTIDVPPPFLLTGLEVTAAGIYYASGYRNDGTEGLILYSADDGLTWQLNFTSASFSWAHQIHDVYFFDNDRGHAPATQRNVRTINGGNIPTSTYARPIANDVQLYPSPVTDELHLRSPGTIRGTLRVVDMSMRTILSAGLNGTVSSIDLRGLPTGAYIAIVDSDFGKQVARFIKQ